MGLFGEVKNRKEEADVARAMSAIGAVEGGYPRSCEYCAYYVSKIQNSNQYGGCSRHGIKAFASYVCGSFEKNY
jgi:hypothetical protein